MASKIYRLIILVAIVVIAVGCEAPGDIYLPDQSGPQLPTTGIKLPPGKTIPIRRKKPLPLNPSPRPLSADYPAEVESYDEYTECNEYEEQDI